jgi:asparagine synthase (glutamine-hydrolysing)
VFGRISTFTGGFDLSAAATHEMRFDERELAEMMANIFKTEHYECVLHSGDMEEVMDELIWHLEDLRVGQCYPNYYVARLAGKFVKVVMSGMGGDELFGGYPWRYAAAVGHTHDDFIRNYYRYWKRLVSNADKHALFRESVIDTLKGMDDNGSIPFRDHTLSVFKRVFVDDSPAEDVFQQVTRSLYFELKTFMHGLLVVEDKMSMAHSLETRVPFLDNELVDFALRIPVHLKVADLDHLGDVDENLPKKKAIYASRTDTGKNILRKAMERILPPNITQAKKQGFSAPDESWFRGESEKYIRDVLLQPGARINEYLNPGFVTDAIESHTSGRANKRLLIWSFLSFEKWLEHFSRGPARAH